ncbi:trigger factor [Haliovirga abyssi]|uniref:Trigger factor n=1 Tax=Haliovirga abyssi TaxID=2996794 RepID=A0AAU9D1T4_9FUSO|nr:trigger factor [Haliovirga abyssi]BDU49961.1 trigger factor [Haliovirga abyssi]
MNYEVKKLENSRVEILIKLEGEEVKKYTKEVVNKIRGKAEIPGFRKGKAPDSVILKQFEEAVKEELAEKAVNSNYGTILDKEGLKPIDYANIMKVESTEDKIEVVLTVDVMPEVKVGQYKGLEIEKEKFELKDEHVEEELRKLQDKSGKLKEVAEGEEAKLDDTVSINFEGFVDGVAFEGGKGENYDLKLGSHSFIDNFEDQIVGHKVGDEFDVSVNFPEQYKEDLAGKAAIFKVKVNAIKRMELPELNDEFAKEAGFETLADLKEKKEIEIRERENSKIENGFINTILEKIKAGSEIEIPEALIKQEVKARIAEYEAQLQSQGISIDLYLSMNQMKKEDLEAQLRPIAADKVKVDLIINEIAKLENVEVKEEEIEERMAEVAKYYGMEIEKLRAELKAKGNYENFLESLKLEKITQKTIDLLVSETIEK